MRSPRRSSRLAALALCALFALASSMGSAAAQPKPASKDAKADDSSKECIAAYEQVQTLRDQGQLLDAREKSIVCARDTCPKALASECAQWLDQLAQSLPNVVLGATSPDGEDLVDVKVLVDGRPLADELGARALPVDPGKHVFKFQSKTYGEVELNVVLREGEKNRRIVAGFKKSEPSVAAKKPAPVISRPTPTTFWVLGGVGAAAVATGVVFESLGLVKMGELEACKPACAPAEADELTRDFVIGDVAIGVGAASLAGALLVYLTRPEVSEAATALAPSLVLAPLPGGAFGGVGARF